MEELDVAQLFVEEENTGALVGKRERPVKKLEWPPPCPTGKCTSQGCVCTKRKRRPADDYYACAVQIHGADGHGMPLVWTPQQALLLRNAVSLYGAKSWDTISKIVGQDACECHRRWLLCEKEKVHSTIPGYFTAKRKKRRVAVLVPQKPGHWSITDNVKGLQEAAVLFPDDRQDESPRDVVDLLCYEDPRISVHGEKHVMWKGLPSHPPEWKSGERRRIPRLWEPCRYVNATSERVHPSHVFLPVLSTEMSTHSLPPLDFWD